MLHFTHVPPLFAILISFGVSVHAETLTGRVVAIADGDTITVLDAARVQHKIRLAGIDAPEKGQPFGQVCKQNLSDMAYDRDVTVDWYKLDRYGRVIGKVLVNGRDVNLEQVKKGCAWHYKKYQNEQSQEDRVSYFKAEVEAKVGKIGLWVDDDVIPPWEWRHPSK